jgi:lysophospholipid acyltransferase (LPLAT)-like uncharacterized protein
MSMKLRHPVLIRIAGFLAAGTVRTLMSSVRTREHVALPYIRPDHPHNTGRFIYAFWHESLLYLAGRYGHHKNVAILISRHADGELIAQACRWMGIKTIRGSTAKAGAAALLAMLEQAYKGHLAITPDGPRGPRQQVQPGTIYLASRSGLPIVPIGVAYAKAWYAPSWDRLGIPAPFSRAAGIAGPPLHVPAGLAKEQLGVYAEELKNRMIQATHQAQAWLARSRRAQLL